MFMYTTHRFISAKREGFLELTVGPADRMVHVPVYVNNLVARVEVPYLSMSQSLEGFLTRCLRYLSSSPNGELVQIVLITIDAQYAPDDEAIWARYIEEAILNHLPSGIVMFDIRIERHPKQPDIIIQYRREDASTPWSAGRRKVTLYMLLNNAPQKSSYPNVQWPRELGPIDTLYLGADYTSPLKPTDIPGILGNQGSSGFPILRQRNINSLEIEVNSLSLTSLLTLLQAAFHSLSDQIQSLRLRVDPRAEISRPDLMGRYEVLDILAKAKGLKKLGVSFFLINHFFLLGLGELPELEELEILDFHAEPNAVILLVNLWNNASPTSLKSKLKKIHVGNILFPLQESGMEELLRNFGDKMVAKLIRT